MSPQPDPTVASEASSFEPRVAVGRVIDRYRIDRVLGEGGMATIYKATHETLYSEHAIKVLNVHSQAVRDRLLAEGRVQARIRHQNLVAVTDVIHINNVPSLVLELVDGPTLEEWLVDNHPTVEEALTLFRGILEGVGMAHRQGWVHRDLKPANVLLAPGDRGWVPKVADFGLVKLLDEEQSMNPRQTLPGLGLGTPQYMSPQQIEDASSVDQRADMFALGCILYELLTGRRAFDGPDQLAIYNAVVSGTYVPVRELVPDLSPEIIAAVDRLLQPDPARRIANCDVLIEILYGRVDSGRFAAPTSQARTTDLKAKLTPIMAPRRKVDDPAPLATTPAHSGPNLAFVLQFGAFTLAAAMTVGLMGIMLAWITTPDQPPRYMPVAEGTGGLREALTPPTIVAEEAEDASERSPQRPIKVDDAREQLKEAREALQEARKRERLLLEREKERERERQKAREEAAPKFDKPRVGFP